MKALGSTQAPLRDSAHRLITSPGRRRTTYTHDTATLAQTGTKARRTISPHINTFTTLPSLRSMHKTILITGCSSGFGESLAPRLARAGHRVYASMRSPEGKNAAPAQGLRDIARAEKLDLHVLALDVTDEASVAAAAERVLAESGVIDVVVNNAGQMYVGITEAFSSAEFTRQLDINIVGVHRVTRAFLPAMRAAGNGLFVNISSVAGRFSLPFFGVYHASKWALEGYTHALRLELAQAGIDAVLVEPGPFTTHLFPGMVAPAEAEAYAASYPTAVVEACDATGGNFEGLFNDPNMPTDPQDVVQAIHDLIDMAPGTRPLRTAVGVDFGVHQRNEVSAEHDAGLLQAFGMTDFARLAVPVAA